VTCTRTLPIARPAEDHAAFAPIFVADWRDALFIHFRVDPVLLQPTVGLPLDLYEGHAYISLVAFTQHNLRPTIGGRLAAWLSKPLASHEFLNLRTYVRHSNERGIYFLAEWIPNRLATLIGPRLYGLPYRLGQLNYTTRPDGHLTRDVAASTGHLNCIATLDPSATAAISPRASETEFLLERYIAFTHRKGTLRQFQIRHDPWLQVPADVQITNDDLLNGVPRTEPCSAHYSQGLTDVSIGRPERLAVRPSASPPAILVLSPPLVLRGRARVGASSFMQTIINYIPLLLFPLLAFAARSHLPAWAFMWLLAFSIFFSFKWLTYRRALASIPTTATRSVAYLFAWTGMKAAFFDTRRTAPTLPARSWLPPIFKSLLGIAILWIILPLFPTTHPLLTGWLGMIALVLLLHFGSFHLLALFWQARGVDAQPLMNRPLRARSLSDLWGNRWNTGFHELSHDLLFRPLRRTLGSAGAMFATFIASGLVHDLVITVPARGGYGLPTLYFTLQAIGITIERSRIGAALHLRRRPRAWLFAVLFTLVPIALLFPPPFVHRVIIPFLHAIGSLPREMP
jgi:uncharacterized protein YqjF (DUF2071 family)